MPFLKIYKDKQTFPRKPLSSCNKSHTFAVCMNHTGGIFQKKRYKTYCHETNKTLVIGYPATMFLGLWQQTLPAHNKYGGHISI